jgi:hypothetical protein
MRSSRILNGFFFIGLPPYFGYWTCSRTLWFSHKSRKMFHILLFFIGIYLKIEVFEQLYLPATANLLVPALVRRT